MVAVEAESIGFAHARSVVRVKRQSVRTKDGKETTGIRTFITSLSVEQIGTGEKLLETIRAHWGIENNNHWKRDANWDEDQTRVRSAPLARLLALLRGALLGMIPGNAPAAFAENAAEHRKAVNLLIKRNA